MSTSSITTAQPILPVEQQVPLLPLNAGGQAIDLPQAAVDAFPDSDLARWADGTIPSPRDEAGRIYLNHSPADVATLTDYLRGGQELNTLSAERLAVLAAESRALHMGSSLDNTIEWEQLRRQVGHLTLQRLLEGPPDPSAARSWHAPRYDADTVGAWLRFQDLTEARGGSLECEAPARLGGMYGREVQAHYAPLLAADPDHARALLFLSQCQRLPQEQRLLHANRLYRRNSQEPSAQFNLMDVFLQSCSFGEWIKLRGDRSAAAPDLARLLRDLPCDDTQERVDRLALANRLANTPLNTLLEGWADPGNSDAALSAGILLRRLKSQHDEARPKQPQDALVGQVPAALKAQIEAHAVEAEQLRAASEALIMLAPALLAERVLQLPDAAASEAPAEWWNMRLIFRRSAVIQRHRLQTEDPNPLPRDTDVDFLQEGYEALWSAYALRPDPAYLAALANNLAQEGEPEVQNLVAAQRARIRAAAALREPGDEVAAAVQKQASADA